MITADAIVKIAPAAQRYAVELVKQMAESGIMANPRRASKFLGQIQVESAGFARVVESMNYRPARLLEVFGPTRRNPNGRNGLKTLEQAKAICARGPAGIAEAVYGLPWGATSLGNTQPGDGARFIGRGLKQLTGRDNYRRFSRAWLGDESLLETPARVAEPDGAVASAIWFWMSHKLNQTADRSDVKTVTLIVNGGDNALAERIAATEMYRKVWRDPADFSRVRSAVTSTETPR